MTRITKSVRLRGGSSESFEDAINSVLARAATTITDIRSFRVVEVGGTVDAAGVPDEYVVTVDIEFVVKESAGHE